jgi:hypothetical protein
MAHRDTLEARHLKPDARVILAPLPPRRRPDSLKALLQAIDASPFRQKAIEAKAGFAPGLLTYWRQGERVPRQANMDIIWQAMQELENGR